MKGTGRKTNQDLAGRLLPIVLLMLPLLALNGGFLFLANIEFFWQEKTGQELARQELEALTASSEFDYQLAHHAGQFLAQLEHSARMRTPEQKLKFIQSRYERIFPDPLTEGTVLAFSREENHKPFDLVFSNKEDLSAKRVFAMVFQHLVDESRNVEPGNETRRQRERLLQKLMGFGTRGDIMATSQRGKASYIIHNNRPHWFVWDYLDLGDDGMVGFMIFLKYGREHKSIGRFLALKECRKRGNGLAGFVPLLKDDKKAVLFEKLARSRLFRSWVNKNVPPIDQNLHRWVQLGFPEEQTLGNYKIFSYLGKNKTHLSVFLLPEKQRQKMPRWLWLINLSVFPFIGLLALRGILLNQWPVLNLSMRFLVLYILMASLPLSLVGIAASGYLYQFSFASQNEIAANLKNCLNQFDVRKSQIQDAYRVSAEQVFNDSILPELIKEYGLTDNRVRDRILGFFRNRPDPLPLLGFYLLDLSGKGLQYYEGTTASRLDPAFEVFKIPIVRTLRKRFAEKHPEIELPEFKVSEVQKFGELAYQSVSSNDLAAETEKRRTFPITRRLGVHTATQIHDFLTVNGKESVLIYIIWDDSSLDARTMGITRDYLGLSYPDYSFIALRKTPSGYEPVFHPGRHVDSDFLKYARTAADSASLRGGSVSRVMGKYSFLAKPSQKYSDAILVGAIDQYFFHTKMRNRLLGLALWIIVALLAVIVCVWLTSIFIVRPISEMRYALESVSAGNLSIRLKSERYDELGLLAENFSSMVKGIDDRRKLAALLSDQAIEAISGERFDAGKKLKARSFEGVALVSDIRGFTTICETMPAVRVTEMLNDHFAAMARIISLNGGRVYKFIGDAIEAIFPENENGNAADLALKAAIQMNHAVNELNLKRRREGLFQYQFGVGLGMGTFFSGQIGSEDTRIDYAVIGEPLVRAAELEACTKKCERIPVAVDEKVKNVCGDFCNFLPIDSESSGFEPSPDAARLNLVLESSRNIASSGAQTAVSDHGETFVIAGELKPAIRKTAFLLFTLFTILTVIAIVWGLSGRNEVRREAEQRNANENIFGFVEQLKSDDAARMAFEIKMKRMISRSEEKLNWDHRPNENERIRKIVEDELKGLEKIGCPDPRAIVFHYDKDNFKSPDPEKLAKTIFAKNFQADKQRLFKALACQKRNRYLKSLHTSFHRIYETKIEEMFGRDMTSEMLLHENFGSAMKITWQGRAEYFFWDFIMVFDPEIYRSSLDYGSGFLKRTPKKNARIVGLVMISVPEEWAKRSAEFIVAGYEGKDIEFALVGEKGKTARTKNFPILKDSLDYNSALPEIPGFFVKEDVIRTRDNRFRLIAGVWLKTEKIGIETVALIIIAIALASILIFFKSIFYKTFLSSSLTWQLWFSMLIIVLLPIITVVFVNDHLLYEQEQTMVVQEKLELQRFIDSFEMRQHYFKTISRDLLYKWTHNPVVASGIQELDQNPKSDAAIKKLNNFFQSNFSSFEKDFGYASNFTPREVFIVSPKGWHLSFTSGKGKKSSELGQVMVELGANILRRLQPGSKTEKSGAALVKSEIYFESGLQTIRSSFGEDEYIRLANLLGELIELEVVTGAAAIYLDVLPSLDKPDYLVFWISMLSSGSYLSRLARHSLDRYAIFSLENHRYGILSEPDQSCGNLDLDQIGGRISISNLPVSTERLFGDQEILIEGRPGVAQFTNFLIGITGKNQVLRQVAQMRFWLEIFLAGSLLIITLVAHRTASDFGANKKTRRKHERGRKSEFWYQIID